MCTNQRFTHTLHPTLVWHYTYGPTIERILREGCLMPQLVTLPADVAALYKREKPAVWFSANQDWEPTSAKPAKDVATGAIIELTTRAEHQEFWGCYRIGVKSEILKPWVRIQKVARIHAVAARAYEKVGRDFGANPYDWWGTIFPVYFYDWKKVQVLHGDQWEDLRRADGKLWEDVQAEVLASAERASLKQHCGEEGAGAE